MKMSPRILDDYEANASKLNILEAARSLEVPLLVVHGRRDESVPVEEAKIIASRNRDASLLIIDNAGHTMNAIHPLVHVPRELVYAAEVSAHFVDVYAR
jgi:pimeloyl-ACP methyl ester carboxylesterase